MPLIITEFAIQSDGTYAVELFNPGPDPVSTIDTDIFFREVGEGQSLQLAVFGDLPEPIPVGLQFVLGHSSIPEVTNPNPAFDPAFALSDVHLVQIQDYSSGSFEPGDHIGSFGGLPFSDGTTFFSSTSRPPNVDDTDENRSTDFSSGPYETNSLQCFAAGTLIATPEGETPVQELRIGDLVATADGRAVSVIWVGRQTVSKRFAGPRAQLVRIAAGTLGTHSDLLVTGDHGMVVDGLLVNAGALINAASIRWVPLEETPDRFTVYHVETEAHEVILANGAQCESYIDYLGRRAFENNADYPARYGEDRVIAEMPLPRVSAPRLLPQALRTRFGIDRAMAL